jgi:membrane protease YdiL (CAAX protease family)
MLIGRFEPAPIQGVESPGIGLADEGVALLALFLATWVMARIERRPVLSYGFTDSRMARRFAAGVLVGVLAMSALVASLYASHLLVFDGQLQHGGAIWGYAVLWAVLYLVVALFEEGLFRGYLLYTLARGLNFWWAALIVSVLFGAAHGGNVGETPVGLISTATGGFVLCLSLWLTRSLWWAVGVHTGLGWCESFLYGVSNSGLVSEGRLFVTHPVGAPLLSGGSTGPEGSLYALPMFLLLAGGIWLAWGRMRPGKSGWPARS